MDASRFRRVGDAVLEADLQLLAQRHIVQLRNEDGDSWEVLAGDGAGIQQLEAVVALRKWGSPQKRQVSK